MMIGVLVASLSACATSTDACASATAGCPCDPPRDSCTATARGVLLCIDRRWVSSTIATCDVLDVGLSVHDATVEQPPTDAGLVCDGDVVAHACPCDGTRLTICGPDIDYVCSHGTWFGHAGLCAMLDAGMPCSDEGRISCPGGHGTVCCYGQEQTFFDGPCGSPGTDGGPACGDFPAQGCPCDPDAGATACDGTERFACTDGIWQPTSYACGSLCGSGP